MKNINKTAVITIVIIIALYVISTIIQSDTERSKAESQDRSTLIRKTAATLVNETNCSELPYSQMENCKSAGIDLMFCAVKTDDESVYAKCVENYKKELTPVPTVKP